jgi:hypothetical protein
MEVLFNEDPDDELVPESNFSQSCDSERPKFHEIALLGDFPVEATPKTSPCYCLLLPLFTVNLILTFGTLM